MLPSIRVTGASLRCGKWWPELALCVTLWQVRMTYTLVIWGSDYPLKVDTRVRTPLGVLTQVRGIIRVRAIPRREATGMNECSSLLCGAAAPL